MKYHGWFQTRSYYDRARRSSEPLQVLVPGGRVWLDSPAVHTAKLVRESQRSHPAASPTRCNSALDSVHQIFQKALTYCWDNGFGLEVHLDFIWEDGIGLEVRRRGAACGETVWLQHDRGSYDPPAGCYTVVKVHRYDEALQRVIELCRTYAE